MRQLLHPKYLVFFINLLLFNTFALLDTIKPTGYLIDPQSFSTISSNHIRLSAYAFDSTSGIKEVRFYSSYIASIDTISRKRTSTGRGEVFHLATVNKPPFEFIWDCSNIPDQDLWRMTFYCDIVDNSNNILYKAGGVHKWVVLDRNIKESNKKYFSDFSKNKIKIDGLLDKDFKKNAFNFFNSDNTIYISSLWNYEFLYFGIIVKDSRIISRNAFNDTDSMPYWYYDLISIFLDINNDKSSFRFIDDKQINLSPSGKGVMSSIEFINDTLNTLFHNIQCSSKIFDSSYSFEIAIPWKELKIKPSNNLNIGFDIFNVDNDFGGHSRISSGWAGTFRSNNNNPSEWGLLILKKERSFVYLYLLLFISFLIFSYLFYYFRKKSNNISKPISKSKLLFISIEEFTIKNIHESNFSLDEIAKFVGLSKDYVRKIIKSESNFTSPQFINNIRIKRSKEFLINTNLSISEIAFKVGYDSLEYFVKVFKKSSSITPSDYRSSKKT